MPPAIATASHSPNGSLRYTDERPTRQEALWPSRPGLTGIRRSARKRPRAKTGYPQSRHVLYIHRQVDLELDQPPRGIAQAMAVTGFLSLSATLPSRRVGNPLDILRGHLRYTGSPPDGPRGPCVDRPPRLAGHKSCAHA